MKKLNSLASKVNAATSDTAVSSPNSDAIRAAEDEIRRFQTDVDYDTKEYPVEVIVAKYLEGIEEDRNELFIPDYQRDLAWSEARQSKFIESVLIGLPIPYLFVADVGEDVEEGGRLEIVDGTQRIRTLAIFISNELRLVALEKLRSLIGFRFCDLAPSRQRRFKRHTLRMIELTEKADEDVRRDIFERINTGSVDLQEMEKRRGIQAGPGLAMVEECAKMELFHRLAPLTDVQVRRRDREELVLRFFTYRETYEAFKNRVGPFLDDYLEILNAKDEEELKSLKHDFEGMLRFVDKNFPHGFAKKRNHRSTPRVRFDAISVGAALALAENPELVPSDVGGWLDGTEFLGLTTSGSSNSRPKVKARIEFVRDRLLGRGETRASSS